MIGFEELKTEMGGGRELFAGKEGKLSPEAWRVSAEELPVLEAIGGACLEFHAALERLYERSAEGRSLLRNEEFLTPWVAEYLDRGKPERLVKHGRLVRGKGKLPVVLRPDLLKVEGGFCLSELDSVPGGIGMTGFLNRVFERAEGGKILGGGNRMVDGFYEALTALRPKVELPVIAIVVSEEAKDYWPEMRWLAEVLREKGKKVFCVWAEEIQVREEGVFVEGIKVDVVYRFFELFDLENLRFGEKLMEAVEEGRVVVSPPMRAFQEEKLGLGLFWHHRLGRFWEENLSAGSLELLRRIVPRTWILDPVEVPAGAMLEGPMIGEKAMVDWRDLKKATQRDRELVLKISGFNARAWGARGVTVGSDCSGTEWSAAVEEAVRLAKENLFVVQEYRKPMRVRHEVFSEGGVAEVKDGRVRLCPYYFVKGGKAEMSGALATFCPPDKKIIHGMSDAVMVPARAG